MLLPLRSVSILLALAVTLPAPCLAQSCVSRLDEYERIYVGKTSPNLPVAARVDALERDLFGSSRTGSMSERLQAIHQMLVGSPEAVTSTSKPAVSTPSAALSTPKLAASMPKPAVSTAKPTTSASNPTVSTPVILKAHPEATGEPRMANTSLATPTMVDTPNSVRDRSAERTKEVMKQAVIAHSKGDLSEAARLFECVLSMDSKNTDANYNLASMAEDRGDLDAALHYYRNAAASSPEDSDIRNALVSVERRLSKRQASPQNPELQELAKAAGTSLRQGDYTGAISKLEVLAEKAPSDASVQFGLSRAWSGKGNLGRSRQYLQGAIALAPEQQMYKSSLQVLDREIQTRRNESTVLGHTDAAEFTTPHRVTMSGDSQPPANSRLGAIVPFTDRGAPQSTAGSGATVGSVRPVLPVGASLAPLTGYANQGYSVNPFDQAILDTLNGMAALNNASRGYPVYSATPYVRSSRMRVGRAGSLTAGILGLLGVGY
jgi:Tfp pilus assembly protein PilF